MTIRHVVETQDDRILEVEALFDQFGERIEAAALAESLVIRFPDGSYRAGVVSTLAIHPVH